MKRGNDLRRRALKVIETEKKRVVAAEQQEREEHRKKLEQLRVAATKELKKTLKYRTNPKDWIINNRTITWEEGENHSAGSRIEWYVQIVIEGVPVYLNLGGGGLRLNDRYDGGLTELSFARELEKVTNT